MGRDVQEQNRASEPNQSEKGVHIGVWGCTTACGAPAGKEGCLVRDGGSRGSLATHRVREPGISLSKKVVINMEKDKI